MKKILFLLFLLVSLSSLTALPDDQATCQNNVEAAISALNTSYALQGLDPIDLHSMQVEQLPNVSSQGKVWHVRLGSSAIVDCRPGSGKPYLMVRSDLVDNGVLYNGKPVPKWTSKRAVEEAKTWAQAFLRYFPKDMGAPEATFAADEYDSNKYYGIIWKVFWPRIDPEGHHFDADSITVTVSEDYGLTGCVSHCASSYKYVVGQIISQADALSASRAPAEELLAKYHLGSNVRLGAAKSELLVSNPNDIFSTSSIMLKADLNARLAWRTEYRITDGTDTSSGHLIVVRIDAHTKKVLGGNFN